MQGPRAENGVTRRQKAPGSLEIHSAFPQQLSSSFHIIYDMKKQMSFSLKTQILINEYTEIHVSQYNEISTHVNVN